MTPITWLPRFREAYRELDKVAEFERWSRENIEAYQVDQINLLWSHARRHVPHYRDLAAKHDLPERFEGLGQFTEQMPSLNKETIRQEPERLLSEARDPGGWHRTGGSTGVPLRVYWSHLAHRQMLWRKYRMEQAWGLDFFDRKAFLWGHSGSFASGIAGQIQRIKRPLLDRLRNRIRLNAYQLADENLEEYLEKINRFGARSVYGYSSAVTLLAEAAHRLNIECPSLQLAILTAEPAELSMLSRCRESLAQGAAIEYGSVECGVMATGMPDGSLRVREDVVHLESDPMTDEHFELVVTVLNNPSFPLIRYQIEDTTSKPLLALGEGLKSLSDVGGRSIDVLIASSGRRVHSLAVKHALERLDGVRRFTAHQNCGGSVKLTLENDRPLPSEALRQVEKKLSVVLENRVVEIDLVDHIAGNRAGKHRWVTSDLTSQTDNR